MIVWILYLVKNLVPFFCSHMDGFYMSSVSWQRLAEVLKVKQAQFVVLKQSVSFLHLKLNVWFNIAVNDRFSEFYLLKFVTRSIVDCELQIPVFLRVVERFELIDLLQVSFLILPEVHIISNFPLWFFSLWHFYVLQIFHIHFYRSHLIVYQLKSFDWHG